MLHTIGLHFKSRVSGSKFTLLALVRAHVWTCVTYPRPMKFNPSVLSNLESRGYEMDAGVIGKKSHGGCLDRKDNRWTVGGASDRGILRRLQRIRPNC